MHELIYYLGAWLESPEGNPRVGLEKLKRIRKLRYSQTPFAREDPKRKDPHFSNHARCASCSLSLCLWALCYVEIKLRLPLHFVDAKHESVFIPASNSSLQHTYRSTDAGCYPYWLLKVTDGTASNRGLASRFSDPDSYVTTRGGVSGDYVSGLRKAFSSLSPPQDATALSNFIAMQTKINSYSKSAKLTAAETVLTTAQKGLEEAEENVTKAKAGKPKTAAKKAKEVAADAETKAKEDFKVIRDEEASERFKLIYAYFELIWKKWSMVDYEYCPLSSQAGAKFVRYLRARLECKCSFSSLG